jgi:heme/copper-type cytochrome/quinol oxidase subunit 2
MERTWSRRRTQQLEVGNEISVLLVVVILVLVMGSVVGVVVEYASKKKRRNEPDYPASSRSFGCSP